MRILFKLLVWLVLLAAGVTAALAAYLMFFFNPNDYRTQIEEQALTEAGLELKINGDIGWSFYPWLGLELEQLSVNYPGQPQLADLTRAGAALNIPALLGGVVQLDSIRIEGLKLTLVRDSKGNENWVASAGSVAAEPKREDEAREEDRGSALRVAIDEIRLSEAQISFEDQIWARKTELTNLNLSASAVSLERAFPVSAQASLAQTEAGKTTRQAALDLSTELNINRSQNLIELSDLNAKLTLEQIGLEEPLGAILKLDLRLNPQEERVNIDNLSLNAAGVDITGKLAVSNFTDLALQGNLAIATFDPRVVAKRIGVQLPTLGEGALSSVEADFKLGGNTTALMLEDLRLKVDKSTATGLIGVNLESGALTANLKVDSINLDSFLTSAPGQTTEAATTESAKGWSKEPIFDAEPLRALNADLKLAIDSLIYQGNRIENLSLDLSAKAGDLRLKQLVAQAFGGRADISGAIDARSEPVKVALQPKFSDIKVEQLLALAMENPPVMASANLSAALTTQGNSMHAIINQLNGDLRLTAAQGVLQGIDMAQELCQKIENITALGISPDQVDRTTPIADLNSGFSIKNGVVTNPSTTASIDAAALDAKGVVDLPNQAFDYNLGLTLTDDLFKQSCGINPALKGVRIPLNCKGNFDTDPVKLCSLDTSFVGEVVKKAIGAKAQAEIDKKKAELEQQAKEKLQESLQDKVGETLKGEAGSLLKGLFGN